MLDKILNHAFECLLFPQGAVPAFQPVFQRLACLGRQLLQLSHMTLQLSVRHVGHGGFRRGAQHPRGLQIKVRGGRRTFASAAAL